MPKSQELSQEMCRTASDKLRLVHKVASNNFNKQNFSDSHEEQ